MAFTYAMWRELASLAVGKKTGEVLYENKQRSPTLASHLGRPYLGHALGLGVLAINGGEAVAVAGRLMLDEASMAKRRVAADAARSAPSVDGYGSARRV